MEREGTGGLQSTFLLKKKKGRKKRIGRVDNERGQSSVYEEMLSRPFKRNVATPKGEVRDLKRAGSKKPADTKGE